jgi:NADH-quinone oxidoreductase subunit I
MAATVVTVERDMRAGVWPIVKGHLITVGNFFRSLFLRQYSTIEYPEKRRTLSRRYRGIHILTQREDGTPKCVACYMCATVCPAQCIYIEAGEYPEGDKRRGYERYPVKFVIDELRCIFCGFCVEACPCDAIRMDTGVHAVPYDSRDQFIYPKDILLGMTARDGSKKTANPRHEPGDPTHPGLTREHVHH